MKQSDGHARPHTHERARDVRVCGVRVRVTINEHKEKSTHHCNPEASFTKHLNIVHAVTKHNGIRLRWQNENMYKQ